MASLEQDRHVFIVRLWREPQDIDGAAAEWRAVIEHVGSSERRSVTQPNDIAAFIKTYANGGPNSRMKRWLGRWRNRFTP